MQLEKERALVSSFPLLETAETTSNQGGGSMTHDPQSGVTMHDPMRASMPGSDAFQGAGGPTEDLNSLLGNPTGLGGSDPVSDVFQQMPPGMGPANDMQVPPIEHPPMEQYPQPPIEPQDPYGGLPGSVPPPAQPFEHSLDRQTQVIRLNLVRNCRHQDILIKLSR